MSQANPLWGAPRIHGELLKLGIRIGQTAVAKYMARRPRAPSPSWRTFLKQHVEAIAAIDMFIVVSATFQMLYVVIVLRHDRRRIAHFGVTRHPTQVWLAHQVTEAFPWDSTPRYLLRDRDTAYGHRFRERVRVMGLEQVVTAPRSPWQNAYVERVIGSIRRDCLDYTIIFNERHLRRVLSSYVDYYHRSRTHLALAKIAQWNARHKAQLLVRSSPFPRSEACTIATNASPPDLRWRNSVARRTRRIGRYTITIPRTEYRKRSAPAFG
jgi:Integrase core domain.